MSPDFAAFVLRCGFTRAAALLNYNVEPANEEIINNLNNNSVLAATLLTNTSRMTEVGDLFPDTKPTVLTENMRWHRSYILPSGNVHPSWSVSMCVSTEDMLYNLARYIDSTSQAGQYPESFWQGIDYPCFTRLVKQLTLAGTIKQARECKILSSISASILEKTDAICERRLSGAPCILVTRILCLALQVPMQTYVATVQAVLRRFEATFTQYWMLDIGSLTCAAFWLLRNVRPITKEEIISKMILAAADTPKGYWQDQMSSTEPKKDWWTWRT